MDEGLQVVFIGHPHGGVGRVYPLHSQLQGFPAAHGAHGRGGGKDPFGLYGGGGEEGIFGDRLEEVEILHGITCLSAKVLLHKGFFQGFQLGQALLDSEFGVVGFNNKGRKSILKLNRR